MHTKVHLARFKWHLFYTLIRNEYLKFLRKHALLAAANRFTGKAVDEKLVIREQHSSILLYDRPIMRPAPLPAKRSGYRYNFDYEQTSDLRFIYQQLKSLTSNVAQLKHRGEEEEEEIYLPPNRAVSKKQLQVTCTYPDDEFHNMPTMQRR